MIYESLLKPWEKIKDKKIALKFDKIYSKLSIHVSQNASFLWYTPAQVAAACVLLTMEFTGLLELYQANNMNKEADPSVVWDRRIERLTGLPFHRDI